MRFYFLITSLLAFCSTLSAQNTNLHLLITDKYGQPVEAAFIDDLLYQVNGITNSEGKADLYAAPGSYLLFITSIGYYDTAVTVTSPSTVHIQLRKKIYDIPVVYVYGNTAGVHHPLTYTNISKKELQSLNYGQDMPMILEQTPSAVATSDAGNGVGYTGIRIRGSDPTRVNISLNGIPFNDAESQQAYWVDLPDFAASVDQVQIQRGVGTSVNGVSAMGASINLTTNLLEEKPSATLAWQTGSFGLQRISAGWNTGLLQDHWILEGRLSAIHSDGYVDRASADLRSFFVTAAWKNRDFKSVLNVFSGLEETYQAWAGIPKDSLQTNPTYNPYTYSDQVDHYGQTHVQWHQYWNPDNDRSLTLSFNLTSGAGYYEQLEVDQQLSDYGIMLPSVGDTILQTTDLITRKWLDNMMYGGLFKYSRNFKRSQLTAGGAVFRYDGLHFGEVIQASYLPLLDPAYRYYADSAYKTDANLYSQFLYQAGEKTHLWADIQFRTIHYAFTGLDSAGMPLPDAVTLPFVNPKAGVRWKWTENVTSYLSVAIAGREPNRDDYVAAAGQLPKPEYLYDAEGGASYRKSNLTLSANMYFMYYQDQLVLTGQLNEVGAYIRQNIPRSYRTGLELVWNTRLPAGFEWKGNLTGSINRILAYTQYLDNWDEGGQSTSNYESTTIAFSPQWIAHQSLSWSSSRSWIAGLWVSARWDSRFVSRQYLDNTEDPDASLDPYVVHDISAALTWKHKEKDQDLITLSFRVNNLLDVLYVNNGWSYRYLSAGTEQVLTGYYPQAGRHFVTGLILHI